MVEMEWALQWASRALLRGACGCARRLGKLRLRFAAKARCVTKED